MRKKLEKRPAAALQSPMDRWLDWFESHSAFWLDTLVRCSGIHNFLTSSSPFDPFDKLFLSNGLNFICTPPSKLLPTFKKQFFEDPTRGWPRFSRMLGSLLTRAQGPDATPYLPKFKVPSPRLHSSAHQEDSLLESGSEAAMNLQLFIRPYRDSTLKLLKHAADLDSHRSLIQHQPVNHSGRDQACIRRLMQDGSITIKPADKNLGMVLVDTSWYDAEMQRMLSDANTYTQLDLTRQDKRRATGLRHVTVALAQTELQSDLFKELHKLIADHKNHIGLWSGPHGDQVLKFLKGAVTSSTCVLPSIYLLIKVHKVGKPLSGRPIVPSTHWATTAASVFVDHLLQEILQKANIPHLVKDTKSLIVELENTVLHAQDGVLVTADIASLYTNIDTPMGLALVHRFLIEQEVSSTHASLIMSLLRFVMENSYTCFHGRIYHQSDGTAMGTPCAPPYANIVVYMLEKDVLADMARLIYLYKRFLDDVLAYLQASAVAEFIHRMNNLHPKLRFDFITHISEASFLDLLIHKGHRFRSSGVFDLSVHQKKMNLYLYIPFHSFHTDAMKRSFIQTELTRYIRNSSDREQFCELKQIFFQRLRDRGYPIPFLKPLFDTIFYEDRHFFLWPSKTLHEHPLLLTRPPRSLCLQRRLARWEQSQAAFSTSPPQLPPPVFVIPYSPLSHLVSTRSLLSRHWPLVLEATGLPLPRPIIAYQSMPSLLKIFVHQRARQQEEERKGKEAPEQKQRQVSDFFQKAPLAQPARQ